MQKYYRTIEHTVQGAGRVLLATHENPDGDGLGALLAFSHYLTDIQVLHTCFATHPVPRNMQFLPGVGKMTVGANNLTIRDHDVVIFFDIGDVKRSTFADRLRQQKNRTTVINIDHHHTKTTFEDTELVDVNIVDTAASATTEMVHRYLTLIGHPVKRNCATCLLTGLSFDTWNFSNLGTTGRSMRVASELFLAGAHFNRITAQTLKSKPFAHLKLWGRALERLKEDPQTGMVTTALFLKDFAECNVDEEAAEGISNFLNELEGGKTICVFREKDEGEVKASMRTTAPDGDVRALAEKHGGGGHVKAAGYTVIGKIVEKPEKWDVEVSS